MCAPFSVPIVLVLIWISWFHVWIFMRFKINLGYSHTRVCVCAQKELQNTDLFSIHSQHAHVFVYIYLWVLCSSRILFVSCVSCVCVCVKYIYCPNLQRTTTAAATTNIPSRQNGKFYFTNQNWTASQQQSICLCRNFYLKNSLKLRFISRMKCFPCDAPFYLFLCVSFFSSSRQYTLEKRTIERRRRKLPKRIQMYTNDFPKQRLFSLNV